MFTFTVITFVLLITTMVNIGVTYIAWMRRKSQNNLYFAWGMIGITIWTFASALDYASIRLSDKIFFAKLEAVGYHSAFTFFALFAMYYTGTEHWLKKYWVKFLFFFIPLSNIGLTLTNELHGWIWSGFTPEANNVVNFEYGPAFNWVIITGYAQLIFIFIHMWIAFRKGTDFTRRQVRILMFALMFPIAFNLLYRLGAWGIKGVDWTSLTFSVSSILFLYALYGLRFLEIVPIAHGQLVASMGDGMIVVDTQNRIIEINPAMERMFDVQAETLISRDIYTIKPFTELLSDHSFEHERRMEFAYKSQYFEALPSALFNEKGKKTYGHLILFRDITERKRIEKDLQVSEERFRQLVTSAPDAVFGVDQNGHIVFANHQATMLLGYAENELLDKPVETIVPDRLREKHISHRSNYASDPFTRAMGSGLLLTAKRKDGSEIPVEINLSHSNTKSGFLVIAFMRDITERRQFELDREKLIHDLQKRNLESETLRETTVIVTSTADFADAVQRILQQLKRVIAYDSASVWLYKDDMAYMIGSDGTPELTEKEMRYRISEKKPDYPLLTEGLPYILNNDIQVNYPSFRYPPLDYIRSWMAVPLNLRGKITGLISLDGRSIGQFTPEDAQLALNYANQISIALENVQLISDLKVELEQKESLIKKLDSANTNLAVEIEDRKQTEILLQSANIQLSQQVDEIRELQDNMRELAIRDPLTHLHNRHYLNETLGRELARAIREGYVMSFILADIDHFKKINDTFGHATGDVVLRAVAKQFEAFTRSGDILVRYGGEEFLLVLPNTSKPAATLIAERLRNSLQNSYIEDHQILISITISCGVSEFPTDSTLETQVLSLADKALYNAKNSGRNKVVVWSTIMDR